MKFCNSREEKRLRKAWLKKMEEKNKSIINHSNPPYIEKIIVDSKFTEKEKCNFFN